MSTLGLLLLFGTAVGIVGTGLPAYLVLLMASTLGAVAIAVTGAVPLALLTALPGRLINLFENDLLQALPLYVLMGVLLDRLPVGENIFRVFLAVLPQRPFAPLLAGIGMGAVLGPMNGSVGASVVALSRSLGPRLAEAHIPPPTRHALVAVASTIGVLVPPSLVLILLGDAMLTAHTIALDATHSNARAMNTQDLFRGAVLPAALFVCMCLFVAWNTGRSLAQNVSVARIERPSFAEAATAIAVLLLLIGLLGGVAVGYFYAVEAAAAGAVALLLSGILSGRLRLASLHSVLGEVLAATGALFAPLVAATTFTLLLRILGTDRLVDGFVSTIPGGPTSAVCVVLGILGISALALDAFEIVFVVVPILIPPLLQRAPDAVWVGVLVLLALQASFLLPPFGYALMMTRGRLKDDVSLTDLTRALVPFLLAQFLVLMAVVLFPSLVHVTEGHDSTSRSNLLSKSDVERNMRNMLKPPRDLPLGPSFGAPK